MRNITIERYCYIVIYGSINDTSECCYSMSFNLDEIDIINVITQATITPSAKEIAASLVEFWVNEHAEADLAYKTLGVEIPWYFWLQPRKTVLVGVMDRIASDDIGIFGSEWKSCKEPQQNKNGQDSAWWNEEVWLESISNGTQLSIYGLALHAGTFVPKGSKPWVPNVSNPRIMVRACVKSNPPRLWPSDPSNGIFEFPSKYLATIVIPALISKAEQIRAAKRTGTFPWSLPGNHCVNRFRKTCPYHEPFCLPHKHPTKPPTEIFDKNDPGYAGLVASGALKIKDPELVVFSASSYDTSQQCVERYRIMVGGYAIKEQDPNLDIGTGMHIGLASLYTQQMLHQKKYK